MNMRIAVVGLIGMLVLGAGAGCYHDKPHEYGDQRPPVDELDSRDRGPDLVRPDPRQREGRLLA